MNTNHRNFAVFLLCALLTGCMVGPNYKKPVVPVPPAFTGASVTSANSNRQNPIAYADWWKVFNDRRLNDLEAQADAANRDIKIAVAHLDQAAAVTKATRSQLFPTVGAGLFASRTREAQNRPNNGNTAGHAATYNDIQLPLFASYEIDAWGRVRRSIESSRATQEATEADLRFVTLSVEANVAVTYYQMRETDQELAILDSTIDTLKQSVTLTTNLFQHGLGSELEVKQAQTLLDQTISQEQALEIQRAQLEHGLAVLLGRTVEGFSVPRSPNDAVPPQIPIGLPGDLLERRPDIVEADRNVAAATAQIGVAKAAYFPQLSLSALAGYESTNATSLVNWQNTIASLGASAAAPIFTGGRLKAGVEQAQATYRQSLAQYEKAVLVSYQETEDQLSALHFLEEQSQSQGRAVVEAKAAEDIALSRYKGGLVSYLDVVFAEQTVLANERTAAQIAGERMVASVVLIKTLGGGWNGTPTP
ncbi:multidrug efflux system outer membrane protein [Edaphobacter aggregans]|jgi:outer membrane protein, multidrug efflux system|uniref:Multidrug efflux system outer membrane protein n=1 Tax=Edaphobacter aggregans TaxID=570835 RepID=A0A428MNC6_9BACT|nr:efflux transporter outer membrane subunit [Edaphobacter aggregans]RSL18411.1 multidrug efflux system outer membrane protein [Edaphobacter aggregans]